MQAIVVTNAASAERLTTERPDALILDIASNTLWRGGEGLRVSPQKFQIVLLMAAHVGGIVSKEQFIDLLWGDDPDGGPEYAHNTIVRQVCDLRREIPLIRVRIGTCHGRGFYLEAA